MKNYLPFLSEILQGKQLVLIAAMVGTSFTDVFGQAGYDYRSQKTGGDWRSYSTWERTPAGTSNWTDLTASQNIPDNTANSIIISAGTTVTIASAVVADQLTVENGATLSIENQRQLTLTDGVGTDLIVNGTVIAKGLTNANNGGNILFNGSAVSVEFTSTGVYQHRWQLNATNDRTPYGIIPVATWHPASTADIYVDGTAMSGDIALANFNQNFGNFKWNSPFIASGNLNWQGLLSNVQGDLEITNTGGATIFLTSSLNTNPNYTLTVGRDFKILNESKVNFAHANTLTGTNTLNIGRSLEVNAVSPVASFTHGKKDSPLSLVFSGTNGTINFANAFTYMNFVIAPNANITLVSNLTLPVTQSIPSSLTVNGRLNVSGTNYISGAGRFELNTGGSLGIGAATGLSATTGNIRTTTKIFSAEGIYIYNGTESQTTGAGLPATVAGLVIDNNAIVNTVELTNSVNITKSLSLQNGVLITAGKTLKLIESQDLLVTVNNMNNSYVDGAVNYEVSRSNPNAMVFPIGKNNVARPVTLSLTQGAGTNTYTASQTETALSIASTDLPTNVNSVSDKRHYTISQNGSASVTNAFVILTYNADEVVSNTEMRIIKSVGAGWMNLGGTLTANNTVTSTIPFTSFSQFAIAYKNIAPLPVELISFKAEKAENAVNVTWATASEKNNAFFSVERSADGKNFAAIGQVEGAGTTSSAKNYAFLDKNPLGNVSYYRLKQVDLDGTSEYSQIVKVVNNKAVAVSLNAYPNPTAANLNIQINGLNEAATLQVIDLTGRVVAEQAIAKGAANTQVNMAAYPAGVYQVKVITANGINFLKVIKN